MFPYRNRLLLASIALVLIAIGVVVWLMTRSADVPEYTAPVVEEPAAVTSVIGRSVEGRDIVAYRYGAGDTHLLFVGGIHGGYEWNSTLLAYAFIDHIEANPDFVPTDLTVTIIPSLNPDGQYDVTGTGGRFALADVNDPGDGTGRFNANGVDLNRNFDCKWAPESTWRGTAVSAGTAPFSEPEAAALRDYVLNHEPDAVVFWHSQSNAVYASECHEGVLPETLAVMNGYATAANYPAVESFDAYPITGDAEGWLATLGIPAITVELSTHETIEWEKNFAGVEALLQRYGE